MKFSEAFGKTDGGPPKRAPSCGFFDRGQPSAVGSLPADCCSIFCDSRWLVCWTRFTNNTNIAIIVWMHIIIYAVPNALRGIGRKFLTYIYPSWTRAFFYAIITRVTLNVRGNYGGRYARNARTARNAFRNGVSAKTEKIDRSSVRRSAREMPTIKADDRRWHTGRWTVAR